MVPHHLRAENKIVAPRGHQKFTSRLCCLLRVSPRCHAAMRIGLTLTFLLLSPMAHANVLTSIVSGSAGFDGRSGGFGVSSADGYFLGAFATTGPQGLCDLVFQSCTPGSTYTVSVGFSGETISGVAGASVCFQGSCEDFIARHNSQDSVGMDIRIRFTVPSVSDIPPQTLTLTAPFSSQCGGITYQLQRADFLFLTPEPSSFLLCLFGLLAFGVVCATNPLRNGRRET
jgi:hypothetical protein